MEARSAGVVEVKVVVRRTSIAGADRLPGQRICAQLSATLLSGWWPFGLSPRLSTPQITVSVYR